MLDRARRSRDDFFEPCVCRRCGPPQGVPLAGPWGEVSPERGVQHDIVTWWALVLNADEAYLFRKVPGLTNVMPYLFECVRLLWFHWPDACMVTKETLPASCTGRQLLRQSIFTFTYRYLHSYLLQVSNVPHKRLSLVLLVASGIFVSIVCLHSRLFLASTCTKVALQTDVILFRG